MNTRRYGNRDGMRWLSLAVLLAITTLMVNGCSFSEASWLSQDIASAQAHRLNVESIQIAQANQTNEQLHEAEVKAQIAEIERQEELAKAEHARKLNELEEAQKQQELLRQAELAHKAEVDRQELALLEQQKDNEAAEAKRQEELYQQALVNAQAEAARQAELHRQELAERQRQADLQAERTETLTTALFIGLLVLFAAISFTLVLYSWNKWRPAARPAPARQAAVLRRIVRDPEDREARNKAGKVVERELRPVELEPEKQLNKSAPPDGAANNAHLNGKNHNGAVRNERVPESKIGGNDELPSA